MGIVQKIGGAEYFQKDRRILGVAIIGASNPAASEADGGESGRCVPPHATAEYGTKILYSAGEVEGLEEHPSSSEFNIVDRLNENKRNESDGVGDIGEVFFG